MTDLQILGESKKTLTVGREWETELCQRKTGFLFRAALGSIQDNCSNF